MLSVDIALPEVEELQRLVEQGLEKGFLTYDEIVTGLDDVELTKEQIEDFYAYLIDHAIELHEGAEHKEFPHAEPAPVEDEKAEQKLDLLRGGQQVDPADLLQEQVQADRGVVVFHGRASPRFV